ncbi:MAG: hypothetical protein U0401_24270 [Anaerolineae bacterium]
MRTLLAVIGSTLVLVVWGMIFWGWLYEFFDIFKGLPNDVKVAELLISNETETGVYFFPWPRNTPETFANFVQQHKTGPFFQLSYIKEGVDPQSPGKILRGVLHYFLVSVVIVALLKVAVASANFTFARKFAVIFLAGLMGTIFIRLGDPIWFHLPWPHALGNALYEIGAWVWLGVAIAAILKPEHKAVKAA